jgi:hypothetical protein
VACFVGLRRSGFGMTGFLLEVGSRQSASVGLLRAFPFEIRGAPFGCRGVHLESRDTGGFYVRFFYWADFATWRALSLSPLFSVLALLSLSLSLERERPTRE